MDLQQAIFDEILARFPKRSQAVAALSDLFQMGNNAIYRRMRGESLLTPEEISTLAKHFQISIDAVIHKDSEKVLFSFPPIVETVKDFESYLNSISDNMKHLHQLKEVMIKYAAHEIPIFQYCFFPELIAFKLYTWGKTSWSFDYLADTPFDFNQIAPSAIRASDALLSHYLKIPSTELWTMNIFDNTLNQIEYYYESGSIAKQSDAILLCDKMLELIQHLKRMAETGKKFLVGTKEVEKRTDFNLFLNEMVDTNNTIIVSTSLGKAIYSTFGNPNFLRSTDERTTEYIDAWFDRIMVKSQPITSQAEKARNQYFNRLMRKVERTKTRLED